MELLQQDIKQQHQVVFPLRLAIIPWFQDMLLFPPEMELQHPIQHQLLWVQSTASGYVSSAIGWGAIASGDGSTALGSSTQATGANALVANFSNIARSYCSTALGRYNDAINTSSTTTWIDTDPLFLIGNGTDNATRKNAVAVLKNGNMGINTNTATHKLEVLGTGIVNGGTAAFKAVNGIPILATVQMKTLTSGAVRVHPML